MPIDVSKTQAALDRLIAALPASAGDVSKEMAQTAQRVARNNLEDPMGPLAESIMLEGPDRVGPFSYRTKAGPTLEYGRQRELGGDIDPKDPNGLLTAHYRAPGYWQWEGEDVFTSHVFQVGQHYLRRAVMESMPMFVRISRRVWGDLLRKAL